MIRYPVLSQGSSIITNDAHVVANLAALKALTSPYPNAVITECRSTLGDGGGGTWVFITGDQSANVSADTQGGVWVAPKSDLTGKSGAWQRQYSDYVNALWFGARGDDSTDNTTALQAAIDYAVSTSRLVRVPSGVYRTNTLTINDLFGVYIEGDGQVGSYTDTPGTLLKYIGTGNCIQINEGAGLFTYVYRITISHLSITFTQAANAGIKATNLQESTFEDVGILGPTANPFNVANGFDFNSAGITNIDNCIVVWVDTAINCFGATGNNATGPLNVTRNNIYHVTTGMKLGVVDNMFVSDNWFEGFQNAILCDNAAYPIYVYSIVVDSNVFDQSTLGITEPRAFKVVNSTNANVINVQLKFTRNLCYFGPGAATKPSYGISFNLTGLVTTPIVNATIADNWFAGVTTAGIYSDTATPTLIGTGNRSTSQYFAGYTVLPNVAGSAPLLVSNDGAVFTDYATGKIATFDANGLKLESNKLLNVQNTQATVGAAGAASALPANPSGYWSIKIAGVEYVVPYYLKS